MNRQRILFLIPVLILLVLAGFFMKGLYLDPRKVPSALIDKPAPEFSLPTMDGKTVTKQDLLGRVYMLNVWASWCEACRYEHPYLVQLKQEGLKTAIIGYNYRDKPQMAQRWLRALGDPYEFTLVDADGQKAIDFGVYGAPETFIIDKTGVIRYKHIGPVTPEAYVDVIKPILDHLEAQ